MRIFKCDTKTVTMQIVDLPRQAWHYAPPRKLEVALTLAGIVLIAIVWSIF